MEKLKELATQETFSRNDLLIIFEYLSKKVDMSACSRIWDMQELLGFDRDVCSEDT